MTTILGIDIGKSKTGIARAQGKFTEPLTVIHEKNIEELVKKIKGIAKEVRAEKVIVGIPEGDIEIYAKEVAQKLENLGVSTILWDETLTTKDAQEKAIEAGIPQKRRKSFEDAFAAAVMLQSYLDSSRV